MPTGMVWAQVIETGDVTQTSLSTSNVDVRDAKGRTLDVGIYSEADHASDFAHKSACGVAAKLQVQHSFGLIDFSSMSPKY